MGGSHRDIVHVGDGDGDRGCCGRDALRNHLEGEAVQTRRVVGRGVGKHRVRTQVPVGRGQRADGRRDGGQGALSREGHDHVVGDRIALRIRSCKRDGVGSRILDETDGLGRGRGTVIHRRHSHREGADILRVHTGHRTKDIGGPTIVLHDHRQQLTAVGVGLRGEGQRAVGADRRSHAEQVGAGTSDGVADDLRGFIGRTGRGRRCESRLAISSAVLSDRDGRRDVVIARGEEASTGHRDDRLLEVLGSGYGRPILLVTNGRPTHTGVQRAIDFATSDGGKDTAAIGRHCDGRPVGVGRSRRERGPGCTRIGGLPDRATEFGREDARAVQGRHDVIPEARGCDRGPVGATVGRGVDISAVHRSRDTASVGRKSHRCPEQVGGRTVADRAAGPVGSGILRHPDLSAVDHSSDRRHSIGGKGIGRHLGRNCHGAPLTVAPTRRPVGAAIEGDIQLATEDRGGQHLRRAVVGGVTPGRPVGRSRDAAPIANRVTVRPVDPTIGGRIDCVVVSNRRQLREVRRRDHRLEVQRSKSVCQIGRHGDQGECWDRRGGRVIHRHHAEGHHSLARGGGSIGGGHGECGIAVVVGRTAVAEVRNLIGRQDQSCSSVGGAVLECASGRQTDDLDAGQRTAVRIGELRAETGRREVVRRVFIELDLHRSERRLVGRRREHHGHRCRRRGGPTAVGGADHEVLSTVLVQCGNIREGSQSVSRDHLSSRRSRPANGQRTGERQRNDGEAGEGVGLHRIEVDTGCVKHGLTEHKRGVLGSGNEYVGERRRIVDRHHRDAHGRYRRVQGAVVHKEREAVGAGEVGRRRVGDRRGGAAQRTLGGSGDNVVGERVAIRIGTVESDGQGRIFQRADRLGHSERSIVGSRDDEGDRGSVRAARSGARAVRSCHPEAVCTGLIEGRLISQVREAGHRDRLVGDQGSSRELQSANRGEGFEGIAHRWQLFRSIEVINTVTGRERGRAEGEHRILGDGDRDVCLSRNIRNVGDFDQDGVVGGRHRREASVAHGVDRDRGAAELVGRRREGQDAVGADGRKHREQVGVRGGHRNRSDRISVVRARVEGGEEVRIGVRTAFFSHGDGRRGDDVGRSVDETAFYDCSQTTTVERGRDRNPETGVGLCGPSHSGVSRGVQLTTVSTGDQLAAVARGGNRGPEPRTRIGLGRPSDTRVGRGIDEPIDFGGNQLLAVRGRGNR